MRIKNIFAAVLLAGICTSASAQFATQTSASVSTATNTPSEGWSSFYVQYNPSTLAADKGDDLDFTGLTIGLSKAFSISQSTPLFLEAGAALQYSWFSEDGEYYDYDGYYGYEEYDAKEKVNLFTLKVPVNLTYVFNLSNSDISIAPYAGINLRYNISGKYTMEIDDEEEDLNLFDDDDMGDDMTWNRFQMGWQIGVNVNFKKAYLGISYGGDFTKSTKYSFSLIDEKAGKDCKMNTTSITFGYKF